MLLDMKLSFTTVEVKLLDTNDNNPNFIPRNFYEFNVSELAEAGDYIGNVRQFFFQLTNFVLATFFNIDEIL